MDRTKLQRAWRIFNPLARVFAGVIPLWWLVETTGNKTGRTRRTPVAYGPFDGSEALVLAVQGEHSGWVRNLQVKPEVRLRRLGRWRPGVATVHPVTEADVARFSAYARFGLKLAGEDPVLVRIVLDPGQQR